MALKISTYRTRMARFGAASPPLAKAATTEQAPFKAVGREPDAGLLKAAGWDLSASANQFQGRLPGGVTVRVVADEGLLMFAKYGEDFLRAEPTEGGWHHTGFRQHGVQGHPSYPAVAKLLKLSPPVAAAPSEPTSEPVSNATLAAIVAQLPEGIDVRRMEPGLMFSSQGEDCLKAWIENGAWQTAGLRQHGIQGHPANPGIRAMLRGIPPGVAPIAPAPQPISNAVLSAIVAGLPEGIDVRRTGKELHFSRDGEEFMTATLRAGQWKSVGNECNADCGRVQEVLAALVKN